MMSAGRMLSAAVLAAVLAVFSSTVTAQSGPEVFFCSGPRDVKRIALTFDDGPGPDTDEVLAVLDRYGVKATFFMQGSQVLLRPDDAREVALRGHEIGSHTFSHPNYYRYDGADRPVMLAGELMKTDEALLQTTGVSPRLVRMPHGYVRDWVRDIARKRQRILVNWTFGCDWERMSSDELAKRYIRNLRSGAILLMHDGTGRRRRTVEALPRIIEAALEQGYEIVPVGVLLGVGPVQSSGVQAHGSDAEVLRNAPPSPLSR